MSIQMWCWQQEKQLTAKKSRMTQASTVRRLLPWHYVAKYLINFKQHSQSDANDDTNYNDVGPDLDDIYRNARKQTTRRALVDARLGQGQYRIAVSKRWNDRCAATGCTISSILRASHIKPWSKSSNKDRLNPNNGILLAAHIDALFDCGLISFADNGKLLKSAGIDGQLQQLRVPLRLQRQPTPTEKIFLAYHRRHVFLG